MGTGKIDRLQSSLSRQTPWHKTFFFSLMLTTLLWSCGTQVASDKATGLAWAETDSSLALHQNDSVKWAYHFRTNKGKPYFHPILVGGKSITEHQPDDHPWHLGLWFSWKYINGVNYWEYQQQGNHSGQQSWGMTEVTSVSIEKASDFSCQIGLHLEYHELGKPAVLEENRTIVVSAPDKEGSFYINYAFEFLALEDSVVLDRTPLPGETEGKPWGGYAGLSLRFNKDLLHATHLNSDGTEEQGHGSSYSWKYYGFQQKSANIGAAILNHPENLHAPTPWHITQSEKDSLYFLQPAPLFRNPYILSKGKSLSLKYRVQFYPKAPFKADIEKSMKGYFVD